MDTQDAYKTLSSNMNKSFVDIAADINQSAINSIGNQIIHSRITLSDKSGTIGQIMEKEKEKKKSLKTSKPKKEEGSEKQLCDIIKKKHELQDQLKRVNYEESKYHHQHSRVLTSQAQNKYFRSTITEEEKLKIKNVIKDTKKTERKIAAKTETLLRKIKQEKQKQKVSRERRDRQLSEKHRQEALEKLQELKNRKQQRAQTLAAANKEYQKVKKQKFLHEMIDQKWKIIEEAEEEQTQRMKEAKAREKDFNNAEILQHSRKYSQILRQNKEKREQSRLKFHEDISEKERLQKHKLSTFFKTISREEAIKKKQMEQKMMSSQIFMTKKTLYAETVREKFKSKLEKSPKRDDQLKHEDKLHKRTKSLDYIGLQKLGNYYMKQVNAGIGDEAISKSREEKNQNPQVFKYPDYLTAARKKRDDSNKDGPQSKQLKEIKKLLNDKRKSNQGEHLDKKNQDRFSKAKNLAKRLDEKALQNKSDYKMLVDSIAAKISILEEFSA